MTGEYETERTVSRVEAAEVLQRVALGVTAGGVRLGDDEDGITVAVPDAVELEVEFESEADESSLEVELEWPDDAVAGQRVAGVLDRETETEGIRETGQEGRDDRDDDGNVDGGHQQSASPARHRAVPSSNCTRTGAASGAGGSSTTTATSSPTAGRATPGRPTPGTGSRA